MTGESIPNKDNWRELAPYYKKLASGLLIVGGCFLMMEHLFMYDGFDLFDIIGHETYGIIMIIAGFLLSMKWSQWKSMDLKKFKNWFR